ncbi:MAG: DUF4157 domain-containing protein, partial [Herpetosiphonaceae bacterium]|nr:DUF4157 domain-containing protein [Herpetosiphonaceae bacterium]
MAGFLKPQRANVRSDTTAPTALLQRACSCGQHVSNGGECAECRTKRLGLQRQATDHTNAAAIPSSVHDVLRSSGRPLDTATRALMEPRFGHDFSHVRVHTDAQATESARAVSALAYTVGQNVVFGAGQYEPGTIVGKRLMAHELTHVVQQAGATGQLGGISVPGDQGEREADHVAALVTGGGDATVRSPSGALRMRRQGDSLPPVPNLQLTPPSLLQSPGSQRPPISPSLQLRPQLLPEDRVRIDTFLAQHRFAVGSNFRPSLDGQPTTLDAVIDAVRPLVLPIIARSDIQEYVWGRYLPLTIAALSRGVPVLPPLPISTPPAAPTPGSPPSAATPPRMTFSTGLNYA